MRSPKRPTNTASAQSLCTCVGHSASDYYCGIYEWNAASSAWVNRVPGLTACKLAPGGWHTLEARALSGRSEMYVDGAFIASWVDASAEPAAGLALQTIDGTASFDDLRVRGASARTYYAFGAARVAERVTTAAQTAGAADVYYLHGDHLGSVSLMTKSNGTQQGDRACYMPVGDTRGTLRT